MSEPKVYMSCLGCYNEGRVHGMWIDTDELERRYEKTNTPTETPTDRNTDHMVACSRPFHDEWAIHDYDGVPNIGENPDIEFLIEVMHAMRVGADAFFHWFNHDSWNMSHLKGELEWAFNEQYMGKYDSPKAFAEEYATEVGWIDMNNNNPLFRYVDFEWYWKSELRHAFTYSNGHVWCCE